HRGELAPELGDSCERGDLLDTLRFLGLPTASCPPRLPRWADDAPNGEEPSTAAERGRPRAGVAPMNRPIAHAPPDLQSMRAAVVHALAPRQAAPHAARRATTERMNEALLRFTRPLIAGLMGCQVAPATPSPAPVATVEAVDEATQGAVEAGTGTVP